MPEGGPIHGKPVIEFIHDTAYAELPPPVVAIARTCVLDLVGVAAAGTVTPLSRIARRFAARHLEAGADGDGARLIFDGRRSSVVGAAFAGAATIDSFDAHDGHALTKGHAGVVVLPAALALLEGSERRSGRELVTSVVIGYEVALRAGIVLHAEAADYHASGAWNALACAALGARTLRLSAASTRHALGIAEFHGPRAQMMRCIEHPTMVKDGSAVGALAGVSAAYLAADGFTGAPAVMVEGAEATATWSDLGVRWRILEQYFKPYPVCRWAQPAMEAAIALQQRLRLSSAAIEEVTVTTFHEASRLTCRVPTSTEEAQYSLPFAVAAAIVRGHVGGREVRPEGFADPEIRRLSATMVIERSDAHDARFPSERWANVAFRLVDGREVRSEPAVARGGPDAPLSEAELTAKYRSLTHPVLGADDSSLIKAAVDQLGEVDGDGAALFEALSRSPAAPGATPA